VCGDSVFHLSRACFLGYCCWFLGSWAYVAATPDKRLALKIGWSLNLTNESGFIIALFAGWVIGNFLPRVHAFVKDAIRPELSSRRSSLSDARGISHGSAIVRDGASDHGAGANGSARADIRHDGGGGADPAIGADGDLRKLAALKGGPGGIASVLMLAAEKLDAGGEQGAIADGGPADDAVASNVNAGADAGLGMGEERSEGNAAGQVEGTQGEVVISAAEIVADASGHGGEGMREEGVHGLEASEPGEDSGREGEREEQRVNDGLYKFTHSQFTASEGGWSRFSPTRLPRAD
jgi:hypothetical protein